MNDIIRIAIGFGVVLAVGDTVRYAFGDNAFVLIGFTIVMLCLVAGRKMVFRRKEKNFIIGAALLVGGITVFAIADYWLHADRFGMGELHIQPVKDRPGEVYAPWQRSSIRQQCHEGLFGRRCGPWHFDDDGGRHD